MKQFCEYDTVIFDCDGVLFDSNFFKEEAFLAIASKYGDESISLMNKILSQFAGSSRYFLFEKFLEIFSELSLSAPNINPVIKAIKGIINTSI